MKKKGGKVLPVHRGHFHRDGAGCTPQRNEGSEQQCNNHATPENQGKVYALGLIVFLMANRGLMAVISKDHNEIHIQSEMAPTHMIIFALRPNK